MGEGCREEERGLTETLVTKDFHVTARDSPSLGYEPLSAHVISLMRGEDSLVELEQGVIVTAALSALLAAVKQELPSRPGEM
jgi:hypothetical protein